MFEIGSDKDLVDELRELEELRRAYQRRHPAVKMDRDDPELSRLLEALAFFSVRTRVSALSRQHALWRRLFRSYFPFLLEPLPMMGIAEAQWTPRLTDAVELSRGTELRAARAGGLPVAFQTLSSLRVLPIELRDISQRELPLGAGTRLVLSFASRFSRSDKVSVLHLLPDPSMSYAAALRLWYELRCNLRRASVIYDATVHRDREGEECQVRFGAYDNDPIEPPREPNPHNQLHRVRSFFHFPQQELYINVAVPTSGKPWTEFHLCFDLLPSWPRNQHLDPQALRVFTVPIANQRRASAVPIRIDGTRESFPILYPQPEQGFSLLSLRGVYRLGEGDVAPLLPLALSATEAAGFELEEATALPGLHPRLRIRQPQALLAPFSLSVDALWYQPEAEREITSGAALRWSLPYRSIDGLSWQPLGKLRPHSQSPLGQDVESLLHLLALRMKPDLDLEGLRDVLSAVQSGKEGFFAEFPRRIRALSVRPVPESTLKLSGIRHQYALSFDRYESEEEPAVWAFLNKVHRILDAWNSDAVVDLTAEVGGSALRLPLGVEA